EPWGAAGAERCPAAWLPALQLLRRGSKAVTRHWKAMHFQRQKLLAVTEYVPPRPAVPPRCLPRRGTEGREVRRGPARALQGLGGCFPPGLDTGVGQSLAGARGRSSRGWLRASSRALSQIIRPVLAQSKFRNLLPLFVCRNILLVSPEARAREMLRVLKGVPQVNLLGACIDDTILSRQGVENFARLPSLEESRGQTVAALSLLSSQTSSLLQRGPAHLTALLDEHIRRLRGTGGATEPAQGQGTG
ncbi:RM10 protein, partial [Tichodroma muraria]|nr:RM10 protein [Tichodroma muraria]